MVNKITNWDNCCLWLKTPVYLRVACSTLDQISLICKIIWWLVLLDIQIYIINNWDFHIWQVKFCVGIQTVTLLVTLWISYGHPENIKRAGFLFEFLLSITLAVIWISRTVAGSNNWMLSKESLRVSSYSVLITLDQK